MGDAAQPLSFKGLFEEARQEFGSPDRGFLLTARRMLTAPGPTVAAAIRGEATGLTRPVRYFLLVFSMYALVFVTTGAMGIVADDTSRHIAEILNASRDASHQVDPADVPRANPLYFYLQYPLISEIVIALLLWLASWPALARMGLTGTQRLVATLYVYGTVNLFQIPLVFLVFAGQSRLLGGVLGVMFVAYLAWTTHGLAVPPRRWAFLRGIAWYVGVQAISAVLVGIALAGSIIALARSGAAGT
jgi:hypothetical protein